ncbi:MAG: type II toxin-antitoxin system PemK/MazF family toxin [Pleurocapsa sp. SU_196_0]|nr:type II toxin-antitoxin system PemK/MazF family toxin [Pleurocapsa sp. SU_196_0]
MKRGEIYWATLEPRSGSEQRGLRPVILVSHDSFNSTPGWKSLIVVPVSRSDVQARRSFATVLLKAGSGGLSEDSVALCHQVTTLDRGKFKSLIGNLNEELLEQVSDGLRAVMQLI